MLAGAPKRGGARKAPCGTSSVKEGARSGGQRGAGGHGPRASGGFLARRRRSSAPRMAASCIAMDAQ
eukprot:1082939-Alexandrium_andersonii.AAC.1